MQLTAAPFRCHLHTDPEAEKSATVDGRLSPRMNLMLDSVVIGSEGAENSVLIHNVSASGLLLESSHAMRTGDRLDVVLPGLERTSATVVWNSGNFHGCAFAEEIDTGILRLVHDMAAGVAGRAGDGRKGGSSARLALPPSVDLGERLFRLRKAHGLTLDKLAAMIGVAKPTVWAWEKGRSRPSPIYIDAIVEIFNISRADLLAREPGADVSRLILRCREQIAAAMQTDANKIRIFCEM